MRAWTLGRSGIWIETKKRALSGSEGNVKELVLRTVKGPQGRVDIVCQEESEDESNGREKGVDGRRK